MVGLTQECFWQQVQNLLPNNLSENLTFCVGFSGGLDSTVLLHLLSEIQKTQNFVFHLKAIHINHQLQEEAESWANFCQDFCDTKKIPLQTLKVEVVDVKDSGIEAAARKARYSAFRENLQINDVLLTAHHLDDQIETVFLHLLRGTGLEGAAGINPSSKVSENYLLRPLLDFSREQLEEYAQNHKLHWIDDPSNFETHFNRNYLRSEVLPIIEKRWPVYRQTMQRFANNARSATAVLDDYISLDYADCSNFEKNTLNIDALLKLEIEKRLMVIRYWIKKRNYSMPGEAHLMQVHSALLAEEDANPSVEWGDAVIRRYRNEIYLLPRKSSDFQKQEFFWDPKVEHTINGLGVLKTQEKFGEGLCKRYINEKIKIVFRQGGEKCQLAGREGRHSLKKLFQEYAVPTWQREQTPLIMINDEIAGVVGYFYCAPFAAKKDESGFIIKLDLELV